MDGHGLKYGIPGPSLDGGAIVNMTLLAKRRNIKIEDWLKVTTQVSKLSQAMGKLRPAHYKGPRPLMYAPAAPPLMSAKCNR